MCDEVNRIWLWKMKDMISEKDKVEEKAKWKKSIFHRNPEYPKDFENWDGLSLNNEEINQLIKGASLIKPNPELFGYALTGDTVILRTPTTYYICKIKETCWVEP